jgi:hypothetical protein
MYAAGTMYAFMHVRTPPRLLGLAVGVVALLAAAWVARGIAAAPVSTPPTSGKACSSFGPTWARSYNRLASKSGNPVRIVSACCKHSPKAGVHWCFVTVTLAGTTDRGCEYVDIGAHGTPVGPGKHETCPRPPA